MIASFREQIADGWIAAEFAAQVHADVFTGHFVCETVETKPAVDKVERRRFGGETFAEECTTVVVDDKAIARFAVHTLETLDPPRISIRLLDHDAVVDGYALVTAICFP